MRLLRPFLRDAGGMLILAVMPLLIAGVLSLLAVTDALGPAELGRFNDQETEEEHETLRRLYLRIEDDSVREGWSASVRWAQEAGDPYPETGPGEEERRYRVPWELVAALDRASDAPPGSSRAASLMDTLRPGYRWGKFQESWSVTCTDDEGNVSHDSGSFERILLAGADFWAGGVSVVWLYRTDSWSSGGCSHTHTYPVLDHREYRPEWSRLEGVIGQLNPAPDGLAQVIELMGIYGDGNWWALLEASDFFPGSQAVAPLIRNLYQAHAADLSGPAPVIRLPQGKITSPFGPRRHPILGGDSFHHGIDFAFAEGDPVKAAGPGIVLYTGWMGGYGQVVVIGHPGGLVTLYAHLSAIAARPEQRVEAGRVLGQAGSTGMSTGSHLHFEVRSGGEAVDPMSVAR